MVAADAAEAAAASVERSFGEAFPKLAEDAHVFVVDSDDGARVV